MIFDIINKNEPLPSKINKGIEKKWEYNDDLYVSQFGDDENGGTSIDSPFKTIGHALRRVYADSLNINTIHISTIYIVILNPNKLLCV